MREKDRKLRRRRKRRTSNLKRRVKEMVLQRAYSKLAQENDQGLLLSPPEYLGKVISRVQELSPGLISYLRAHRSDFEHLSWHVVEHLVAEFLASRGFEDVRLVGRDPFTSADIYAAHTRDPLGTTIRFFVEVKHQTKPVGVEVINTVLGAMMMERNSYGWHAGIIVSTGGFRECRRYPPQMLDMRGLQLRDKDDLMMWLDDYEPNGDGLWLPTPARKAPSIPHNSDSVYLANMDHGEVDHVAS